MPAHRLLQTLRAAPAFSVFLLAFAMQLLVLSRFSQSPHFIPDSGDMKFYNDWAQRITHGQWTDHQAFYGLPGYAFGLAAIYKVCGGPNPFGPGLLQTLMYAGVAALLYKIAVAVFAPSEEEADGRFARMRAPVIGTGAALLWMLCTPAQTFSMILMPTIWLVLAYYTCVWWAVKTTRSSWWHPWLALGVFVGVTALLVATIFFALPLLIVAIFLSVNRDAPFRARLPKIAAAILALFGGVGLGISPAPLHNYFIAHDPVMLTAHSGVNIWIGNNPTSNGYPKMPPGIRSSQEGMLKDSITVAEKAAGHPLKRAEVSRYWSEKANAYIRQNRPAWLRLMGVKFGNFWNAYQYDDVGAIKRLSDDGILWPGLRFGFIAALGLAGLLPAVTLFPRARWVAAAVVLHMGALLPVFVTERYRLAALPGLMLLAAFGLWQLWANLVRGHWLGAATYLALAGGAATFVSIPRPDPGLWSLDFYNAGTHSMTSADQNLADGNPALAEHDFETARHNFETAFAYVQDNSEINFALGNLWLAKSNLAPDPRTRGDERALAKDFYKRTLALKPNHASALNNLGVLAMEEKRWDLAEKFLLASLDAEPDDAKTYFLLARVRFESGRADAAKTPIKKALELRPAQKEFLELRDRITAPVRPPSAAAQPPSEPPAK